jgi:hypothetical protein
MFSRRMLLAGFVLLAGFACTFDPQPKDGEQQCSIGKRLCPDGYVCGVDTRCYKQGHQPVVTGTGGAAQGTGGSTPISGTGGVSGKGGIGKGGTVGTGGKIVGSGGIVGIGGVVGSGGIIISTGGVTSTGGTTIPRTNTGTTVAIVNYRTQGAMNGFAWMNPAPKATVTDPTCASPAGAITNTTKCEFTNWSTPNAYCFSGSMPALPDPPTKTDFDENWGIQVGINATDPPVDGLGQSFTSMAVTVTGGALSSSTETRISLHRKGDPDTTAYCAPLISGSQTLFTSFNTACWSPNEGLYLKAADVQNIDHIVVQVLSRTAVITMIDNLCVTNITFVK